MPFPGDNKFEKKSIKPSWAPKKGGYSGKFTQVESDNDKPAFGKRGKKVESSDEEEEYAEEVRKVDKGSPDLLKEMMKSIIDANNKTKNVMESIIKSNTDSHKELSSHLNTISENTMAYKDIAKYLKSAFEKQTESTSTIVEKIIDSQDKTTVNLTMGIENVIGGLIEKIGKIDAKDDRMSVVEGWDAALANSNETIILAGPNAEIPSELKEYRRYNGIKNILEDGA
ncbi:hypothetical protein K439DRAFT_1624073 [Ramaria rubella]|nr:hypothetical protein K439DRAFT_1624073 [Ramaria rubella]